MYRVSDLVARLQELDQDLPVLLQKDPEGNGFFWASGVDADAFVELADLDSDRSENVCEIEDTGALLHPEMDPEAHAQAITDAGYVRVAVVFP